MLIVLVMLTACDKRDSSFDITKLSSDELLSNGWSFYLQKNYDEALPYFSELSTRDANYLKGYHALGWTYFKKRQVNNSVRYFERFFDTDSLEIYSPIDTLYQDSKAGLALNAYLISDFNDCINHSNQVINSWSFVYEEGLNYDDIMLLKIISFYNLQRYEDCVNLIRIFEPNYNVDYNFLEGVILLGDKIEQLKATLQFYY